MIEGADYIIRPLRFPNRANKALVCVNDDGTFDIYVNTLFSEAEQMEAVKHELRHIEDEHFYVDIPIQQAERQADGESLMLPIFPPAGKIAHFRSQANFAHWVNTVCAQKGIKL